ncbi:aldehyde dehydrogenase (NADP(+)) [Fuerstiella marisgermanici]|uniref:NADP-dependent fatty aldehyde dehydrogenase n=1 Tax=Fuerstiella marisgermanici TaxID=1891926 RepID=A0A1P8WJW4_9PLAN|nr:aldehyde dehydrogenase (NADP(+)) [Fuerstiella marisgermanici]APZ94338.1 NADP-dependent fatty aldehyde dehydrogenase [Fuerstiella marisgermanici]
MTHPVLINGAWVASETAETFQAINPTTQETLPGVFPLSPWSEIDKAIQAASDVAKEVRGWPGSRFAEFLNAYADEIEARADDLVAAAHAETALPVSPRLKDGELPRTTNQLRQAAEAAETGSWRSPIIDTATGIRSVLGPIGPVVVFGPNNFPFAFNGIAGGDFAAAIAAGNPVIAKGHSSHPDTTRIFGEAVVAAIQKTNMPKALVQLIYRTSHEDGYKLVSDQRIAASGYTGARHTGLKLKAAADAAGKPFYAELSSINPVFILQGALAERADAIADDFSGSCLMGTGQFCTNPGMVIVPAGSEGEAFVKSVAERFQNAAVGTMLGEGVQKSFAHGIETLKKAGAVVETGGEPGGGNGFCYQNTLLTVPGSLYLKNPEVFQTEAFGNGSLVVLADDVDQMKAIAESLEGNLTGCVYSDTAGADDDAYRIVEPALRTKVGRLLNDKMPTGVAVSAAMNHGGPFPATGHPGFTAVGLPTSAARFGMLMCYDNVRPNRLPEILQDKNPSSATWRRVDGQWTTDDVS